MHFWKLFLLQNNWQYRDHACIFKNAARAYSILDTSQIL